MRLRGHEGGKNLAAKVGRKQAAIDDFVPLVIRNLLVGYGGVGAGAVDQHIDLAVGRDRRIEQGLHAQPLISRNGQKRRRTAEGLDRFYPLVTALLTASGDDDACPGLRQPFAERSAENARAANDDGDLVVEAEKLIDEVR